MINYNEEYWKDVETAAAHVLDREKLFGSSILITGATGMICSSVTELLFYMNKKYHAGIRIRLAGRSRERMQARFYDFRDDRDYEFMQYDATSDNCMKTSADYLIHGASNANPAVYTREPVETMLANILGLNHLLKMAVETKSRRLLYISSSEVYGNKEGERPYREDDFGYLDILNQRASYPSAKRAAETLCIAYGQEYGLDTVIVRPGHIYGPAITDTDSRASAQFTRNAVNGEDIIMKSTGTQLRSYCYTLDCASAILSVLMKGEQGTAYNISNRDSIASVSDIAEAFAGISGRKVVYEQPTDTEKKGYNLMLNSSLDSSRLEKLGWSAAFSLEQGTRKTSAALKE